MIIWSLCLWMLKVINALANIIIVLLLHLKYQFTDPNFNIVTLILMRSYAYIVDFLLMVTLIYLFYCQSILQKTNRRMSTKNLLNIVEETDPIDAVQLNSSSTKEILNTTVYSSITDRDMETQFRMYLMQQSLMDA